MSLKVKFRTIFPALVTAASPLTLVKSGLWYAFGFDIAALRTSLDPIYLVGALANLILNGSTSGTVTVKAPAVAGSNIITVPAATDTLVGKATTDTLSNKTIDTAAPNVIKVGGVTIGAGQFPGTGTNDNAAAGNIGEFIPSTVLAGAATPLVTGTAKDITSINLTAGDWDVWGSIGFSPNAATTVSGLLGWINTASASSPTAPNGGGQFTYQMAFATGGGQIIPVGRTRLSLAAPTTVYLTAIATFGVNTMAAYGFIGARRVR